MARLSFASLQFRGWLTLSVPVLLAFTASAAHGQGRGFHQRTFMAPSMMRPTTPAMAMPARTPLMMSTPTNALLRRDVRLDSLLLRDSRFLRRDLGLNPFWGTWGGGFAGSGLAVIPVGVASGTTTPVAQETSGDTSDTARAALLREQAVAERLANRRRAFDELQYERDKTATAEQELLSRSRTNPSAVEVTSGQALNALLTDLRRLGAGADDVSRPDALLPLDRAGLRHLNVTRGPGNVALLKDNGRLTWPAALAGPAFQEPRDRLTARTAEAVRQAGRVDPVALRQMAADVGQLRALLRQNKEMSFQSFVEARDYLQRFDDALVALGQSDVADHFNGAYELKSQTVLGLVKEMTDAGLRFAPATPRDEAAYAAIREALAACDGAAANSQSAAR
jgi:hypothetical protein